jgi:hypothetical protein
VGLVAQVLRYTWEGFHPLPPLQIAAAREVFSLIADRLDDSEVGGGRDGLPPTAGTRSPSAAAETPSPSAAAGTPSPSAAETPSPSAAETPSPSTAETTSQSATETPRPSATETLSRSAVASPSRSAGPSASPEGSASAAPSRASASPSQSAATDASASGSRIASPSPSTSDHRSSNAVPFDATAAAAVVNDGGDTAGDRDSGSSDVARPSLFPLSSNGTAPSADTDGGSHGVLMLDRGTGRGGATVVLVAAAVGLPVPLLWWHCRRPRQLFTPVPVDTEHAGDDARDLDLVGTAAVKAESRV